MTVEGQLVWSYGSVEVVGLVEVGLEQFIRELNWFGKNWFGSKYVIGLRVVGLGGVG